MYIFPLKLRINFYFVTNDLKKFLFFFVSSKIKFYRAKEKTKYNNSIFLIVFSFFHTYFVTWNVQLFSWIHTSFHFCHTFISTHNRNVISVRDCFAWQKMILLAILLSGFTGMKDDCGRPRRVGKFMCGKKPKLVSRWGTRSKGKGLLNDYAKFEFTAVTRQSKAVNSVDNSNDSANKIVSRNFNMAGNDV